MLKLKITLYKLYLLYNMEWRKKTYIIVLTLFS
jgi:hypothetical protein